MPWMRTNYKTSYRIYSRISREILDKIRPKFYLFDLYTGHKKYLSKCTKTFSGVFQDLLFTKIKFLNYQILDIFCHIFFNSTYTRVYTVAFLPDRRFVATWELDQGHESFSDFEICLNRGCTQTHYGFVFTFRSVFREKNTKSLLFGNLLSFNCLFFCCT